MWISLGWQYTPLILAWTHRQNTSNKTMVGLDFPWYATLRCELAACHRPWIPHMSSLPSVTMLVIQCLHPFYVRILLICSTSVVCKAYPHHRAWRLLFLSLAMMEWACYLESDNKGLELVPAASWVYRAMQGLTPLIWHHILTAPVKNNQLVWDSLNCPSLRISSLSF